MRQHRNNPFTKEEEAEYILLCRKDIAHFKPLYEAFHHQILNYIYHKVMDRELAADICSQVFLKAMLGIKAYKIGESSISAWLYKIAFNETMMHFRKSKKTQAIILDEYIIDGIHQELEEFNREGILSVLENLLRNLGKKDVELIELRYYEGMSYQEIGQVLNCTETTAKVRAHRLMMKLKKLLKEKIRNEAI